MKNECNIVRDILPLYVEDIASEDTALFLQEHISVCSKCRAEYESMKNPDVITSIQKESTPLDAAPIKAIKKLLIIKRMQTIIFTAMIVMALLISFYAALDAPNFFPYNDELLTVSENPDCSIMISFSNMVTSYSCDLAVQPDNGFYVYYVEAWDSLWDKYIENRGSQTVTLSSPNDKPFAIYYVQNNGDDDICLYKSSVAFTGDSISLPSLTLGYYMLLAIILEVALVVLFFYSKDNLKITLWLARLLPLPISYLIGHLIICGFQVISYSVMHDLPIIIFLSILIYLGFLCAVEIIRLRNELKSLTT